MPFLCLSIALVSQLAVSSGCLSRASSLSWGVGGGVSFFLAVPRCFYRVFSEAFLRREEEEAKGCSLSLNPVLTQAGLAQGLRGILLVGDCPGLPVTSAPNSGIGTLKDCSHRT